MHDTRKGFGKTSLTSPSGSSRRLPRQPPPLRVFTSSSAPSTLRVHLVVKRVCSRLLASPVVKRVCSHYLPGLCPGQGIGQEDSVPGRHIGDGDAVGHFLSGPALRNRDLVRQGETAEGSQVDENDPMLACPHVLRDAAS